MLKNIKKFLVVAVALGAWVIYITYSSESVTSKNTASKDVKPTETTDKPKYTKSQIQDQIDEVIRNVDKAINTESTAKSNIQKVMDSGDTLNAYDTVKTASDNVDDTFSELNKLTIPDSIPSDAHKMLNDAVQNVKQAVTQDQLGYKDIMKYIDNGKTSDLFDAKSKFEMSNQFVTTAKADEDEVITKNK